MTRPATSRPSPTRRPSPNRPPSVERVLALAREGLTDAPPTHEALARVAREVIADERKRLAAGASIRPIVELAAEVIHRLDGLVRERAPRVVINATGVIVHTNLGRAPWPAAAIQAAAAAARGYLLLEMDPETGRRGARSRAAEAHLIALTGAADALVVNNNAAAAALAVGLAGRGGGVAVSRGELVEIGGGVRIPDIVRRAGGRLVEVGTTNRTRAADFGDAFGARPVRVVLRIHPSNFRQSGFIESPDPRALAGLAHAHGAIVIDDLGSGALLDTAAYGLAHEPTPADALADGADIVTFSGDKLLGGPQAGLIVGRADLVARLRRDPLARAMRPDKVTLAALAATLGLYRAGRAVAEIPVWRMIALPAATLRTRADALAGMVAAVIARDSSALIEVVELRATVGGGSLPGETLPSWGVAIRCGSADRLLRRLRSGDPAIIGRIADGAVVLDLRTVDPADDDRLVDALRTALDDSALEPAPPGDAAPDAAAGDAAPGAER
ncbi:MAG: L-seryl-tRNA(Sec) selenium transferase [Candidatus Limnocylindrales bacterium]